jgi:hypothetical protein
LKVVLNDFSIARLKIKPGGIAMLLTVKEARIYDVNKDIARVHKDERNELRNGEIARISVNGRSTLVVVRGIEDEHRGEILLDEETRNRLQVKRGDQHDFFFSRVGMISKIRWAYHATDPMARISVGIALWLGGISVSLGLLGVVVALWPILRP